MSTCTYGWARNVVNLGNSIIGVSILAMPYCFSKCGILLSLLLIIASGFLTRVACHILLKAAIMARRRNFEFLAFHVFGPTGKLFVEIGIIGFLIGVCIAFFVVVGDLGPPLASEFLLVQNTSNLRAEVLLLLGIFVALPLGMLKKVDSLTSFSALSLGFYVFLVLKIICEAFPKLTDAQWYYQVNWWQPAGLLSCLPIFSMALSCQTQLFEFFDTLNEPSLKRMNSVISGAVHVCSAVYISVGVFGYIAFCDQPITGNILVGMTQSLITEVIKLLFIVSVVISFPLCLFPCRTSLHSLLFKQSIGHHDMPANHIPDHRFKALTIALVTATIGIAIMIPNIEIVLGIIGSTIGTLICLILPALIFIHTTSKNTNERMMAQLVLIVGIFILVACTYSTLQDASKPSELSSMPGSLPDTIKEAKNKDINSPGNKLELQVPSGISTEKNIVVELNKNILKESNNQEEKIIPKEPILKKVEENVRQEPPVPEEPIEKNPAELPKEKQSDLDPEALKKEDKEIQKEQPKSSVQVLKEEKRDDSIKQHEELLLRLQAGQEKQQKLLEESKKLLEEIKQQKNIQQEAGNEIIQQKQIPNENANTVNKDFPALENMNQNPMKEAKIGYLQNPNIESSHKKLSLSDSANNQVPEKPLLMKLNQVNSLQEDDGSKNVKPLNHNIDNIKLNPERSQKINNFDQPYNNLNIKQSLSKNIQIVNKKEFSASDKNNDALKSPEKFVAPVQMQAEIKIDSGTNGSKKSVLSPQIKPEKYILAPNSDKKIEDLEHQETKVLLKPEVERDKRDANMVVEVKKDSIVNMKSHPLYTENLLSNIDTKLKDIKKRSDDSSKITGKAATHDNFKKNEMRRLLETNMTEVTQSSLTEKDTR